jgi:hypothetical protein
LDDIFEKEGEAPAPLPYANPYEYAPVRLRRLLASPARLELLAVVAMLAIMFVPHVPRWMSRWRLNEGVQLYAFLVVPAIVAWAWLARWRILLPELDWLNEQFTEKSVLRWLVEERHEEPKRLRWVLALGVPLTLLALWSGEPTLTCLAFVVLLAGICAYRLGTHFLRVVSFPFLLLSLMIPIPAIALDWILKRIQPMTFKVTTTLLAGLGLQTEVTPEGNPIQIFRDEGQTNVIYEMYAGQLGMGYAEAAIFLIGVMWYLSLVQASFARKLSAWLLGLMLILILLVVRLTLIGWLGSVIGYSMDGRDWVTVFAFVSRLVMPFVGWGIMSFVLKGLRCRTYHEWVHGR